MRDAQRTAAEVAPPDGLSADRGLDTVAAPSVRRDDGAFAGSSVRLTGPGRLTGQVLDRDRGGAPVPDVVVRLLPTPPVGSEIGPLIARFTGLGDELVTRAREVARTRSRADGSFAFEGVREGRWFLDVVSDAVRVDGAPRARVRASGSGGPVEVWVRGGGRVVGRVVDADGAPVPGADVAIGTGAMRFLEALGDGDAAFQVVRSDSDGRFSFGGLPAGEGYDLSALGPGIAITHVNGIDVALDRATEVVVTGRRPSSVRGRVVGAVDGEEPVPIPGAKVAALPRGIRNLKLARELLVRTHAVTGPDGSYELEGVAPGTSDVLAIADGHLPGRGPAVFVPEAGSTTAGDLELVRGPMVEGVVLDAATREPVSGARVLWTLLDVDEIDGQPTLAPLVVGAMESFEFPTTGDDGRFRAGPFPDESPHAVRVLCPGYANGSYGWDPGSDDAQIVVELSRGGSVTGTVVEAATGEPVGVFDVSLQGRIEGTRGGPTTLNPWATDVLFENAEGRFTLPAVTPGSQTIEVLADGFLPERSDIFVDPLAGAEVRVALRRGGRIVGRVIDPAGEPVGGAQVTTDALIRGSFERMESMRPSIEDALAIRGEDRRPTPPVGFLRYAAALGFIERGLTTTEADGTFELAGLEPGVHDVLVFHRDFETGRERASLVGGTDPVATVEIELSAGATVFGTLTDGAGRPIPEGTVVLASPGLMAGAKGGDFRQARTGSDGSYEVTNLSGGPYVVVSAHADEDLDVALLAGSFNFGFVFVPKGGRVRYDVVDESRGGCRVAGRVLRGGDVVTDGLLVANATGGGAAVFGLEFKVATIEKDGAYAFEGLEPGEYRITYEERGQRRRGRVGEGRGGSVELVVPDATDLAYDIELPEGGVFGVVAAGDDGSPLSGVRVVVEPVGYDAPEGRTRLFGVDLSDASRARVARTDGDGRFSVLDLAEGEYIVEVERTEVERDGQRVALMAPEPVRAQVIERRRTDLGRIELEPGLELEGRVVDGTGAPVAGASVVASWAGGATTFAQSARGECDEEGRFVLLGVRAGAWRVRGSADGFAPSAPVDATVEGASGAEPVRLTLRRGASVELVVTDSSSGAPRVGVAVTLRRASESGADGAGAFLKRFFSGQATTGGDGRLELGRLERGVPYVLELSADGVVRSSDLVLAPSGSGAERVERVFP
ncbi:MAG: carboxypeptidase regulatory-like domain-containing protein [Planctomycetota bacterium]